MDYSILMTNNYMDARRTYPEKARAIKHTVSRSALSILTSGTILTIAGYGLYFVSSVAAIGGLGHLIGRGALISVLMVLFLLPVLLTMADPLLMKEEAKKVRLEEARLAARQKKRDLKEQMKQKMEQMKTEPQKEPPSKNLENEVKEHEK